MRLPRLVFLSVLGLVSGCGGCDSCFGTKQPGDDDATAPLPVKPVATAASVDDAGDPSAKQRDAGSDAASSSDSGAVEVPRQAAPERPKAPMPKGAFQSCGVYEGPRCERECDKGNCRQECDGVECTLACNGGYCSQFCGPNAVCRFTCKGGHCVQVCSKSDGCIKECAGGHCE